MKRIALVTGYGWAGITVSLAMIIEYFTKNGYFVDIYFEKNERCDDIGLNKPLFHYNNSQVLYFNSDKTDTYNYDYEIPINQQDLDDANFIHQQNQNYELVMGFDPQGFIKAGLYSLMKSSPLVYFSLEFYEKEDQIKDAERFFSDKASLILTQDQFRAQILSQLLKVPLNKFAPVYNSTIGERIQYKSSYLKDLFNIDSDKKIVLISGSLFKFTGVDKILRGLDSLSSQYVYVLHGWTTDPKIEQLIQKKIKEFPSQLFYSNKPLPHSQKFDIFASADIGIMYYEPIDLNLKYAAWSAGKMFDLTRCGVPILANNIPNMYELIEGHSLGKVIENFDNISSSLDALINKYSLHQDACYSFFETYTFTDSLKKALKKLKEG